jgi:hypothetical protein
MKKAHAFGDSETAKRPRRNNIINIKVFRTSSRSSASAPASPSTSEIWAISITGDNTYTLAQHTHLRDGFNMKFYHEYELPRSFDEKGKLVSKFDDIDQGWWAVQPTDLNKIIRSFKRAEQTSFFKDKYAFRFHEIQTTASMKGEVEAAMLHGQGLQNFVDLAAFPDE